MKSFIFLLITFFISWNSAWSQKITNASGKAQFRLEEHMSKDELREKLRKQAMINAIESEFGSLVEQETFVDMEDGKTEFKVVGATTVRGEWLKTINERFTEQLKEVKVNGKKQYDLWITCEISGKVREIRQPSIDFQYHTSKCPQDHCWTDIFQNGESMYFFFESPREGYLSIYVVEEDVAYRLLPYQQMTDVYPNAVPVEANKEYVFFSNYREHDYFMDFSYALADELLMITDKKEEFLKLYIIYSTDEFLKPVLDDGTKLSDGGLELPKSLPLKHFKGWLEDNRIHNVDFYYRSTTLKIEKK
jgi:hypothetical protein